MSPHQSKLQISPFSTNPFFSLSLSLSHPDRTPPLFVDMADWGAGDNSSGAVCGANTRAVISDTWEEQGG
ncbi:hypothetical protein OIU84_001594 [Salix udensis]|uniref:Uncharacterized protein n=1 Tax=Salix udensis TaxID=889485 RepID=A0AAD6K7G9_9ROSI|nr:hypothetical protein OIU84_001594 [Salix udensis]